jgi:hypothetical protein
VAEFEVASGKYQNKAAPAVETASEDFVERFRGEQGAE